MEKDFNKWLFVKPHWVEISFQYNTGRKYQHKQDLVAIFWNGYIYIQQKFENYFKEFSEIPFDVFKDLIFDFRQNFPKHGRVEGVNYFDDLIEQLIEQYKNDKKFSVEFFETYKNEVTPGRIAAYKKKLESIESLEDKLEFCYQEKKEYLQNISAETFAASGNTGASTPIFFDKIIQLDIDDIERKMKMQGKKPPAKTKKILTYDWTGKPQNKTVLHKAMKSVFIDKGTGQNDFCIIFENKNTAGIKQVIWLRGATDLLQFLYEMMEAGLIKDERDRMNYKRLTACFCKEDGSQFNEAFKELFNPIKNGFTTQKKDIIELVKLHK